MDRNGKAPKKPQPPKPAEALAPPAAVQWSNRAGNAAPTAPRHGSGRKR